MLTNAEVSAVYFGPAWSTNPSYQNLASQYSTFLGRLVNSSYMDQLREYSTVNQIIHRGTFVNSDVTANGWTTHLPVSGSMLPTIADADITNMLGSEIAADRLPPPDANRLYVVYVAPNTVVTNPSVVTKDNHLANSLQDFTGYHGQATDQSGRTYTYAVVVDPTGYGKGNGPAATPANLKSFQYATITTSHEMAEAITDPDAATGWRNYDKTSPQYNDEIGDLAQDLPPPGPSGVVGYILDGYAVQMLWSNNAGGPILRNPNFVVSGGTLTVNGDQDGVNQWDSVTLDVDATGSTLVTLNGQTVTFQPGTVSSINLQLGGGFNTVKVNASLGNVFIGSSGYDTVTVGNGSLIGLGGTVTVSNGSGTTSLVIDDHADPNAQVINMNGNSANFTSPTNGSSYASFSWSGVDSLSVEAGSGNNVVNVMGTISSGWTGLSTGSGNNTIVVAGTSAPLSVTTGNGSNTVNVTLASAPVWLNQSGQDTVNLGLNGQLGGITGGVNIYNWAGTTSLTVDDHAAGTSDTITLNASALTVGQLPAISWAGLSHLYLHPSYGGDTINVHATSQPVDIISNGADTVTVGQNGSVQGINGTLTITNPPSYTTLTIDDSSDTATRSWLAPTISLTSSGITGLAPAPINFAETDLQSLTILGGLADNQFNVYSTPNNPVITTTLQTSTGSNSSVFVWGANGPLNIVGGGTDTVYVGNFLWGVQGILGALTVTNPTGFTTLTIDDAADTTARYVTVTNSGITGLAPAPINYDQYNLRALNISGGSGGNTFSLSSTPSNVLSPHTTLHTGAGNDTVKITPGTNNPDLSWYLLGSRLALDGGAGVNTLDYSSYTQSVTVDLQLGVATAVSGGVSGFQNVIGGQGNNLLVGGGAGGVLTGGRGRNLIIDGSHGSSQAQLIGGGGDNLLIGGYTAYDQNLTALNALFQEWTRTDETFAQRIADLRSGGGLNGSYVLNGSTVFDASAQDQLTGGAGADWFLAGPGDVILNQHAGDQMN
jgi:hypothetical protein